MKKLSLLVGAILISVNCYAGSASNLNMALTTTFENHSMTSSQNPFAIIYGGQDFSHPQMAIANESVWSGQPRLIG